MIPKLKCTCRQKNKARGHLFGITAKAESNSPKRWLHVPLKPNKRSSNPAFEGTLRLSAARLSTPRYKQLELR